MEKVFYNGRILTMCCRNAAEEKQKATEAVLVRDGRIAAVGKLSDLQVSTNAEYCDLNGKCLMPGFIDPHSHFLSNAQMTTRADLSACTSFDDIVRVLKAHHEKHPDADAILGSGYDHNFLKEGRHPDKFLLDRVSTELPVYIQHISLHFACANSVALKIAELDESVQDPDGGRFGRVEGSRELSGYLEETATGPVSRKLLQPIEEYSPELIAKMQEAYLQYGITTVQDSSTPKRNMEVLAKLAQEDKLLLDVVSYPTMTASLSEMMQTYAPYVRKYCGRLKIGGYKIILDGSPQGRSAWMSKPYLGGDPDFCSYPRMSDEQVQARIETAQKDGMQILAHCNGDAASEQFVAAYERALSATGIKDDLRPVMIHCQTVRNDQLDRMKAIHMIASIFVGHVWYWGDIHIQNFGPERGHHISPAKDALERGVHVNFHQDTPVTRPNMLHSVWCAVNRISRRGNIIGADQKIPVYDALRAVTAEGAYQYFEEDEKGTIEIGKRADFVILDKSPLDVPELEIRDLAVLETIKDGVTVYRNPSCQ
ncbi:MAG: amidohydrolase [Oscillospiraceae bacterium]|nr:amidohydrolase [Oscillospiraceae bacterium]